PALTEIALCLKQPFLDWIARLGTMQRSPREWWASALASKSPLQSDLFFLVCYGEVLARWAGAGAPVQMVVVEDPWLWTAARAWFTHEPSLRFSGDGGRSLWQDAVRRRIAALWTRLFF